MFVNATIGHAQERRAERSLEALRRMLVPVARVRRDGLVLTVPAAPSYRVTSSCWKPATAYRR